MSQPSGEHTWPFQPHCRINSQCSCDLKSISPDRDVAQAHGSALCLPHSLGRGEQDCSLHPRFSIYSILQLFTSLETTDEPDSLQRSWYSSLSCSGLPSPSPLVCGGLCGGPWLCGQPVHLTCDRHPQEHGDRIIKSWNHQGWKRPPRSLSSTANIALPRKASSPSLSAACCHFRIYFVPLL